MPILRTLGKIVGSFFFSLFLVLSVSVYAIVQLIAHENLKPVAVDLISKQFPQTELNLLSLELKDLCKDRNAAQVVLGGKNFDFDCTEVNRTEVQNMSSLIAGKIFDEIYFREYPCDFIACFQDPNRDRAALFISATAYQFFGNLQFAVWVGTAISALVMLISIESWEGRLKGFGTALIFTGLPFFFLWGLQHLFSSLVPVGTIDVTRLTTAVFGSMLTNYFAILVLGTILYIAGFVMTLKKKTKK